MAGSSSSLPLRYHWLRFRAVAHPTEDVDKVAAAMRHLVGLDAGRFEAVTERLRFDAHHGGQTTVLETTLTRSREVRDALDRLLEPQRERGVDVERRVDDDGVWTIRFSKQDAFQERIVATDGEDAVQVRLKMMVHPASREGAIQAIHALLAAQRA